jgi:hypothetical protein
MSPYESVRIGLKSCWKYARSDVDQAIRRQLWLVNRRTGVPERRVPRPRHGWDVSRASGRGQAVGQRQVGAEAIVDDTAAGLIRDEPAGQQQQGGTGPSLTFRLRRLAPRFPSGHLSHSKAARGYQLTRPRVDRGSVGWWAARWADGLMKSGVRAAT